MANQLKIQLTVDDKGSVVVKDFAGKTEQSLGRAKTSTQGLTSSWTALGVAAAAAAGLVAYKMQQFGSEAIAAASNLEEVSSKFSVVFKGQEALAESWSTTLVDAYAMSTRESKQYLSSVQDLLVPMGMASDEAGKMSNEVVKLSADLGSFNNMPTARVMDDIQSALVGNYETMKKYGVVLNMTTVQQKALGMGLAETKAELTASHKAQAAYALMVEGSTAAIGDMARTSDSYANQLKAMQAGFEDLQATIGERLLPTMTKLVGVTSDVVDMMTLLAGGETALKKHAEAAERLHKAWEVLAWAKENHPDDEEIHKRAKKAIDKASIALGRQAVFYKKVADAADDTTKATKSVENSMEDFHDELEDFWNRAENYESLITSLEDVKAATALAENSMEAFHRELDEYWDRAEKYENLITPPPEKVESELHEITKIYDTFLERTQGAFADTFYDIFREQWEGWSDLFDNIENLFYRMLSEMAAKAAMTNLMPSLGGVGAGAKVGAETGMMAGIGTALPWVGAMMAGMYYGDYYSQVLSGDIKPKAPWLAATPVFGPIGLAAMPFAGEKKGHRPHVWGGAELGIGPRGTMTTDADILTKLRGKGNVLGWETQMDEMVDVTLETYADTMTSILTAYGKYTGIQFKELSTKIDFGGYHGTHLDNYADATMKKLGTALESYTEEIAKDLGFATFEAFQEYVTLLEMTAQASAQTIAQAFGSALETGVFEDFAQGVKQTLYENVKEGIVTALMESAKFQSVLQPFYMTLTDTIEKSTAKGGFNERKFMRLMTPALAGLDAELSRLQPMFEKVAYVTDLVGGSLFPAPLSPLSPLAPLSIPAYQHGTDYVPRTGLAVVHEGERITPAGSDGGVIVTMNFHGPILANDLPSILAEGIEQVNRGRAGKGIQLREFQTAGLDI